MNNQYVLKIIYKDGSKVDLYTQHGEYTYPEDMSEAVESTKLVKVIHYGGIRMIKKKFEKVMDDLYIKRYPVYMFKEDDLI